MANKTQPARRRALSAPAVFRSSAKKEQTWRARSLSFTDLDDATFEKLNATQWQAYAPAKPYSITKPPGSEAGDQPGFSEAGDTKAIRASAAKSSVVDNRIGPSNPNGGVLPVNADFDYQRIGPGHFVNYNVVDKSFAVSQAHHVLQSMSACPFSNGQHILPIFGDCSAIPNRDNTVPMRGAYAVVVPDYIFDSHGFLPHHLLGLQDANVSTWKVAEMYESTNAELLALAEMLNIVLYLRTFVLNVRLDRSIPLVVYAFTDSKHSLKWISEGTKPQIGHNPCGGPKEFSVDRLEEALAQPIVRKIIQLVKEIETNGQGAGSGLDCFVRFQWIPGHNHRVYPHVQADKYSRSTAKGQPELLANILRQSSEKTRPPYQPLGAGLQRQVQALARSHFALDDNGRGLSVRGRQMAAGSSSSWLRQFTRNSSKAIVEKAEKILSYGLACGSKATDPSTNENKNPGITQRAAKRKLVEDRSAEDTLPPAKRHHGKGSMPGHPMTKESNSKAVPPSIAAMMARVQEFPKPSGRVLGRQTTGRNGRH